MIFGTIGLVALSAVSGLVVGWVVLPQPKWVQKLVGKVEAEVSKIEADATAAKAKAVAVEAVVDPVKPATPVVSTPAATK